MENRHSSKCTFLALTVLIFVKFVRTTRVAVLVIGQYRVYDGSWPSHERNVHDVVRSHRATKRLDVFVCTENATFPRSMPCPSAVFKMPDGDSVSDFKISECFRQVEEWAQLNVPPQLLAASGLFSLRYDYYIRTRPDVLFAYPMNWPPPSRYSAHPFAADIFAPLDMGNFAAYAWSDSLTISMLTETYRGSIFKSNGNCPPNLCRHITPDLHSPCADITDQIAIVSASYASVYFGFPQAQFRFEIPSPGDEVLKLHRCSFWQLWQSKTHDTFPPEGRLNYRLRKSGAVLAPWDFGYILAPSRKVPLTNCDVSAAGSLGDCLVGRLHAMTLKAIDDTVKYKNILVACKPGKRNESIPMNKNLWQNPIPLTSTLLREKEALLEHRNSKPSHLARSRNKEKCSDLPFGVSA